MTDVLIRKEGRAGRITLNRPKALNSLTAGMLRDIEAALDEWRADDAVALVLIDGAGDRAFAAGGDVTDLYHAGRAGDFEAGRRFWAEEYRLNAKIARYPKPYVAIMHGFVMGGGVGVSAHGSHRIVTDGSQVALPECAIGLVPDVGGSWLLAQAPGRTGEYLGVTGARMGPADAIYAGFADSYVPAARLDELKAQLEESGDVSVISGFSTAPPEAGELDYFRLPLDDVFSAATAVELEAQLERAAGPDLPWSAKTLEALRRGCPLSVAATMVMVREARAMTLEDALEQEYRFVSRVMEEGEFLEGVRAMIIDKDRAPKWAKPALSDVTASDVERMLRPAEGGDLWTGGT